MIIQILKNKVFLCFFVFAFCLSNVIAAPGDIKTVAGSGPFSTQPPHIYQNFVSDVGDGKLATDAILLRPSGVFLDSLGQIYIADTYHHRIRKVDLNGIITTIAGNGRSGFSGDGGPAISASLSFPNDVAVDKIGNVYVADTRNDRIRKIDPTGNITTVKGTDNNIHWPFSIRLDTEGNLYVAERGHYIKKIDILGNVQIIGGRGSVTIVRFGQERSGGTFSGDGGSALEAHLNQPKGLFLDSGGDILFADHYNHRVRRIAHNSNSIHTLAGDGFTRHLLEQLTWQGITWGRFSGDEILANKASMNQPSSVLKDGSENILIADTFNHRIRVVYAHTGMISTVIGNPPQGTFETGISSPIAGDLGGFSGDGGPASLAHLDRPQGIFLDQRGDLYIADSENNRIRKVDQVESMLSQGKTDPKRSDFDDNGKIDFSDFLIFVSHYGQISSDADFSSAYDLDGDNRVGFGDFLEFVFHFGSVLN